MILRIFGPNQARLHKMVDARMIDRPVQNSAAANHVQPRVTDMRPDRHALLNDAGNQRRPRRLGQAVLGTIAMQLAMSGQYRVLQKPHRIGQQWLRIALINRRQRLQSQLRRHLSARVATHSIRHQHQQRVARVQVAHAVLIDPPAAFLTLLVNGKTIGQRRVSRGQFLRCFLVLKKSCGFATDFFVTNRTKVGFHFCAPGIKTK